MCGSFQIDISEDNKLTLFLFEDLSAPARFLSGIESLSTREAEQFKYLDQMLKVLPTTAVGVVIMVGPAQSQRILSCFLNTSGPIAALPVVAFRSKEEVTGPSDSEVLNGCVDDAGCFFKTSLASTVPAVDSL